MASAIFAEARMTAKRYSAQQTFRRQRMVDRVLLPSGS
jgi:hypothetical protein